MSENATNGPDAAKRTAASEPIDPKLLELLVCPVTKTTLRYDAAHHELVSRAAGLAFPIRNGVAMMAVDAARQLDDRPRGS